MYSIAYYLSYSQVVVFLNTIYYPYQNNCSIRYICILLSDFVQQTPYQLQHMREPMILHNRREQREDASTHPQHVPWQRRRLIPTRMLVRSISRCRDACSYALTLGCRLRSWISHLPGHLLSHDGLRPYGVLVFRARTPRAISHLRLDTWIDEPPDVLSSRRA